MAVNKNHEFIKKIEDSVFIRELCNHKVFGNTTVAYTKFLNF